MKSHKESTPCLNYPVISSSGSSTSFGNIKGGFSFGSSKRFDHYISEAKKSGYRVGPGSYQPNNNSNRSHNSNAYMYKTDSAANLLPKEGFYRNGSLLLFNEKLLSGKQKKELRNSLSDQRIRSSICSARDSESK